MFDGKGMKGKESEKKKERWKAGRKKSKLTENQGSQ